MGGPERYAHSVNTVVHAMEWNRSMHPRKLCPQCYAVLYVKRSVCDPVATGHAFASKKRKAQCTAVGEPENAMKCRKALLSEEELLVRKETKSAKRVRELLKHVSRLCTDKNKTEHMASMRASETFEQTIHRQEQNQL